MFFHVAYLGCFLLFCFCIMYFYYILWLFKIAIQVVSLQCVYICLLFYFLFGALCFLAVWNKSFKSLFIIIIITL